MKRTVLFLAGLFTISMGFGQNLAKSEAKSLAAFLSQTSAEGRTNASSLGLSIDPKSFDSAEGITIENGHVTAIDWQIRS